jgi:hypothetical protein
VQIVGLPSLKNDCIAEPCCEQEEDMVEEPFAFCWKEEESEGSRREEATGKYRK